MDYNKHYTRVSRGSWEAAAREEASEEAAQTTAGVP